jgi:hypothetical protein
VIPEMNIEQTVEVNSGTANAETINLPPYFFNVDTTALDADLCSIGKLMLYYADIETRLGAEVETRKARLKELEGELDLSIRATSAVNGDRLTEAKVGAMVVTHSERRNAQMLLVSSERNHNLMKWAMRILQGKRDILIALTYREKELIKSERF